MGALARKLEPPPEPTTEITDAEAAAMMRAVFNLFQRWRLSDPQGRVLLGQPSPRTYARWKAGKVAPLAHDTKQRLAYLMGIHKATRYLFKEPMQTYAWIGKPNRVFAGQSALERMLAGDVTDLATVRTYLDAERGGW